MTREARMFSGIILITVPTIQYGGYFLLTSLMNKTSGYTVEPPRPSGRGGSMARRFPGWLGRSVDRGRASQEDRLARDGHDMFRERK